ncbi:MAG: Crp/Fnr family transcriptional regulator [Cyclobacteriaceae bacterium]
MTQEKSLFIDRISAVFPMTTEEIEVFSDRFEIEHYKKGDILLKEGDQIDRVFFNLKGIIRQYKLIDGVDKSMFFFIEDQIIRLMGNTPEDPTSPYHLECLEDSTLCVAYSREDDMEFVQKYPRFEALCMTLMDDIFKTAQDNQEYYINCNPEQRYQKLLDERPELVQRVAQQHLASFLGFTPESMSRIKKRIHEKIMS